MTAAQIPTPDVAAAPPALRLKASVVLLDIEGTIGPISFVRDVLFAYARQHLPQYVADHRDPAVAEILQQASVLADGGDPVAALLDWQDRDEKVPPLKKLQGLVWDAGYRSGAFRSIIYADALAALTRWHAAGLPLYIYSSGSVNAQLQYFEFNASGDLRHLFRGHFDTDIGSKVLGESYVRIAQQLTVAPGRIVFFSDSPDELRAAESAGLQIVQVARDGLRRDSHPAEVSDFSSVEIAFAPL